LITHKNKTKATLKNAKRILVPIDGSLQSLKALNGAVGLFNDAAKTRIFALNEIEWTNDEEESLDGEMTSKIEEEGRRMLGSVVISPNKETFERIVKIGDPYSKIVELAEKLDIELIKMGSTGIGNTDQDLGHVTRKVLKITSKPVVSIGIIGYIEYEAGNPDPLLQSYVSKMISTSLHA
jgi:nucleotide-binding universal stress UspA family protein